MDNTKYIYNTFRSDQPPQTEVKELVPTVLPQKWNLKTTKHLPVLNQVEGSCVSQCGANAYLSRTLNLTPSNNQTSTVFLPSRLFLYYFARVIDGSDTNQDTGSSIEAVFRVFKEYGCVSELEYPYIRNTFTNKPPESLITKAKSRTANFTYKVIPQTMYDIKNALVSSNEPIVFGVAVYESFESDSTLASGNVPLPTSGERLLGYHCLTMISYDDTTSSFGCQNSWGLTGIEGIFQLPYDYIMNTNLSFDFFQIVSI